MKKFHYYYAPTMEKAKTTRFIVILLAILISCYALRPKKSVDVYVTGSPTATLKVSEDFSGYKSARYSLKVLGSGNVAGDKELFAELLDENNKVVKNEIKIGAGYKANQALDLPKDFPKVKLSAGEVKEGDTFNIGLNVKYINLGLDLVGGSEIIYEIPRTTSGNTQATDDELEGATKVDVGEVINVIHKKLENLKIKESIIQPMGDSRLLIQLPGVTRSKVEEVKIVIGTPGKLEFKPVIEDPKLIAQAREYVEEKKKTLPLASFPYKFVYKQKLNAAGDSVNIPGTELLVEAKTSVSGKDIRYASKSLSGKLSGGYAVNITFNSIGDKKFGKLTERISQSQEFSRLAIILEGALNSAPTVDDPIYGGRCEITGNFTSKDADKLVTVLRSGSMDVKPKLISENTVGPSLGADSISSGVQACLIGGILVILAMVLYYKKLGLVAVFALVLNLLMLLGALALGDGTLTLPGIAGFALTIGMAVDATVLIYERLREESAKKEHIKVSLTKGYERAFITIFDSNFTTFITALIMFSIGNSGPVKGFCSSLMIGLIINLFAAVFVTQTILAKAAEKGKLTDFGLKSIDQLSNINFFELGKKLRIGSYLVIAIGFFFIFSRGGEMYDVDFNGGYLLQVSLEKPSNTNDIKAFCKEAGHDAVVQTFGQANNTEFTIRTAELEPDQISALQTFLREKLSLKAGDTGFPRSVTVGGVAAKEMFAYAFMALVAAMLVILFYIMVRFHEFKYGLAACVALVHDVFFTLGFIAIFDFKINLTIFAAILTVIGYSLNDTIVIFDRIRENIGGQKNFDFKALALKSLNQTLTRTIRTSVTTFLVVGSLLILGGGVIKGFAFTMFIGLITGTYSSLFIASPFVLLLHNRYKDADKGDNDGEQGESGKETQSDASPQTPETPATV